MSPNTQNTPSASLAPRKRGGQPGNTNSLKHGYYSTRFSLADLTDLENHSFSGLQDEITLLRVFTRRVVELSTDLENLPEAVSLLRVLSMAMISLSRLMRTHHLLGGDRGDEISLALDQALKQLSTELPFNL